MNIKICDNKDMLGHAAAAAAAEAIQKAITENDEANIVVATGISQIQMLEALVEKEINWSKVTAFHLDEYVGLPEQHPASFRKYLKERFVDKVGGLKNFYFVNPGPDPEKECERLDAIISKVKIDVACVGIGENGHLAFNDPPADFETDKPFLVLDLDEACRRQQLNEGWFPAFEDVPKQAISMSIRQIMKSRTIICSALDERKAEAVRMAVEEDVSNLVPASILQEHPDCTLFLDTASACRLRRTEESE